MPPSLAKPPAPPRVHVTFADPKAKKSRTFTVYNAGLQTLLREFQEFLSEKQKIRGSTASA